MQKVVSRCQGRNHFRSQFNLRTGFGDKISAGISQFDGCIEIRADLSRVNSHAYRLVRTQREREHIQIAVGADQAGAAVGRPISRKRGRCACRVSVVISTETETAVENCNIILEDGRSKNGWTVVPCGNRRGPGTAHDWRPESVSTVVCLDEFFVRIVNALVLQSE